MSISDDGEYIIEADFENIDGVLSSETCHIFVDSSDPGIEEISSEGGISLTGSGLNDLCFDEGVTINIYSFDNETGVTRIDYKLINDNSVVEEGSLESLRMENGRYVSSLSVNNSFTGILCVNAIDKLGNNSGENSTGIFSVGDKKQEEENDDESTQEETKESEKEPEKETEEEAKEEIEETKEHQNSNDGESVNGKKNDQEAITDDKKDNVQKNDEKSNKKKNTKTKSNKLLEEDNEKVKDKKAKKRKPVIRIKGIKDGQRYKDNIAFSIVINDEKISKQDVIISLTRNLKDKIYLTDMRHKGSNLVYDYNGDKNSHFLVADGEYELSIKVYDRKSRVLLNEKNKTFFFELFQGEI